MLHSGIDLHKRTVVISTVDAEGRAVRDAELPTSRARIQSYFASPRLAPSCRRVHLQLVLAE